VGEGRFPEFSPLAANFETRGTVSGLGAGVPWRSTASQRTSPGDLGGVGRGTWDLSRGGRLAGRGLLYETLRGELCHSICFSQLGQAGSLKRMLRTAACSMLSFVCCGLRIIRVLQASNFQ